MWQVAGQARPFTVRESLRTEQASTVAVQTRTVAAHTRTVAAHTRTVTAHTRTVAVRARTLTAQTRTSTTQTRTVAVQARTAARGACLGSRRASRLPYSAALGVHPAIEEGTGANGRSRRRSAYITQRDRCGIFNEFTCHPRMGGGQLLDHFHSILNSRPNP